ncbi:cysteinyl leukotriene receptor 1 [Eupeodes corollae]|uniref:cysteinyl leukotriene receptor 1 n=1 Tax=Eupeodes corollae TaxID=290404 RepID=UPI002493B0F2|nr:cysteinyl leukotriene receptor 1 [Eupeodes corollae]
MMDYNSLLAYNQTDLIGSTPTIPNRTLTTNDTSQQHQQQYPKIIDAVAHYLTFYYTPIIVFGGSIGNILSVFVFFKTNLRKLSSSFYLAALAVSDTLYLLATFASWLGYVEVNVYNRDVLCQFFVFTSSLCSFCSVWYVVAFTVERFIAVMYPLKRQTMCTVKRAKIVLAGITLLGCLHCTPYLLISAPKYNPESHSMHCSIRDEYMDFGTTVNYVDTVVVFAVPLSTIAILNTFTGCTVWKFATVRRTMTLQKRKTQITRSPFSSTYRTSTVKRQNSVMSNFSHPNGHNNCGGSHRESKSKPGRRPLTNSSQLKVTKMLLIVSTVFVFLNLPSYFFRVKMFLEKEESEMLTKQQYIANSLFVTNFGINFVLYCVSGQNFRKALISLFRSVSSSNRDGTTQVTVSEYFRNSGNGMISRRRPTSQNGWGEMHEMENIIHYK